MGMHDDDEPLVDIANALNRSYTSTESRIKRELEARRRETRGPARNKVSAYQEAERQRRKDGYDARDLTSTFFGDPPRGFSALDKIHRS